MKIPVQEKIAELERRIEALEQGIKFHSTVTRQFSNGPMSSEMWKYWDEMWASFDKVMKAAFGRKSSGNNILDSVSRSEHIVPCQERESA